MKRSTLTTLTAAALTLALTAPAQAYKIGGMSPRPPTSPTSSPAPRGPASMPARI